MAGINQIDKEVVMLQYCLRWVYHVISKDFLCHEHGNLVAKILKSSIIQYDYKKAYGLLLLQAFWTLTFFQLKVKHLSVRQL